MEHILKKINAWYGQTSFEDMERISGIHQDDFHGFDWDKHFIEAVDEWWNNKSAVEKQLIFNKNLNG